MPWVKGKGKGTKAETADDEAPVKRKILKEEPQQPRKGAGKSSKGKSSTGTTKGTSKGVKKTITKEEPQRPWRREEGGKTKGKSKGKDSYSKGSGKGKSKGKGKGKGKGKLRAAPLNSHFWERKLDEENRKICGDTVFSGKITKYILKFGWGFILPDDPASLPKKVKTKLAEAKAAAEEAGKEVQDENLIYFRKPDVHHADGFRLGEDVYVTFQVYVDDKGAGACEVTQAEE